MQPVQLFLPVIPPWPDPNECCRCRRTKNEDNTPVTWFCQVCKKMVCRECTLTRYGGSEYYEATLCSEDCRVIGLAEATMLGNSIFPFED